MGKILLVKKTVNLAGNVSWESRKVAGFARKKKKQVLLQCEGLVWLRFSLFGEDKLTLSRFTQESFSSFLSLIKQT